MVKIGYNFFCVWNRIEYLEFNLKKVFFKNNRRPPEESPSEGLLEGGRRNWRLLKCNFRAMDQYLFFVDKLNIFLHLSIGKKGG